MTTPFAQGCRVSLEHAVAVSRLSTDAQLISDELDAVSDHAQVLMAALAATLEFIQSSDVAKLSEAHRLAAQQTIDIAQAALRTPV